MSGERDEGESEEMKGEEVKGEGKILTASLSA